MGVIPKKKRGPSTRLKPRVRTPEEKASKRFYQAARAVKVARGNLLLIADGQPLEINTEARIKKNFERLKRLRPLVVDNFTTMAKHGITVDGLKEIEDSIAEEVLAARDQMTSIPEVPEVV